MFQGYFQDILRVFQGYQRVFQGGFRDVLRKFQGGLKKVSSVFQENFIKSSKGVSSFVLQFFCSMNLIAAIRAEGGLVSLLRDDFTRPGIYDFLVDCVI